MADFSAEKVYRNIKRAAKQKGIRLKDLETSVGTYAGYCTANENRVAKKDYRTGTGRNNINMEMIWRFSQALGVTINDLIEGDF
mgnify:CR=1 FL=1